MPIALYDFVPRFCPGCGKELAVYSGDTWAWRDYQVGCSHGCECGVRYQHARTGDLLEAAAKVGDLPKYERRDNAIPE